MMVPGYDDLVEVGRGGNAIVYRARQLAFDRVVALKVLARVDLDEQALHRFERECKAAGALSWHPHIVAVYDAATTEAGMPYLSMEYLEGGALSGLIEDRGRLGWEEVAVIGVQLAGALETAHQSGTLHRDVKPENVLIGHYGEVKLTDFGIAALEHGAGTITAAGVVTATIAHAAPEVLAGQRATAASDVYSLGSTLFTLLARKPAFVEPTDEVFTAAILRVTNDPVPDLRAYGVPETMARLVERAMAKDPSERPESAAELGRALQEAQRDAGLSITDMRLRPVPGEAAASPPEPALALLDPGETVNVGPPQPPRTPPAETDSGAPPPAPPRSSRWRVVVAGALVALAAGVAVWATASGGDDGASGRSGSATTTAARASTTVAPVATVPAPPGVELLSPIDVIASGTAPPGVDSSGNPVRYDPELVSDGNTETAWRVPGPGVGDRIVLRFAEPVHVGVVDILPGYAKIDPGDGTDRYFQNRRVLTARFHFDDGSTVPAAFVDDRSIQRTPVGGTVTTTLEIEIVETTVDPERDFTAISEIQVFGEPVAGG